jgi:hypothetical protein
MQCMGRSGRESGSVAVAGEGARPCAGVTVWRLAPSRRNWRVANHPPASTRMARMTTANCARKFMERMSGHWFPSCTLGIFCEGHFIENAVLELFISNKSCFWQPECVLFIIRGFRFGPGTASVQRIHRGGNQSQRGGGVFRSSGRAKR